MIVKIYKTRLGNALGLQLVRILFSRILLRYRRLWKPRPSPEALQLRRRGIVVIRNFLPSEQFEQVLLEFQFGIKNPHFNTKRVLDTAGILRTSCTIGPGNERYFAKTKSYVLGSQRILDMIRSYDGRRSIDPANSLFQLSFWRTELPEHLLSYEKADHTNTELHSDSFQSVIKCFYYLNDADKQSGAHVYIPGSHRVTFGRAIFEYINSVIWMRESARLKPRLRWLIGGDPLVLEEPANTLIIEDTFGFHAASMPTHKRHRDIVYLQYRSSPFH